MFDQLVSLDGLAEEMAKVGLFSRSTLEKLASGNYSRSTLDDFPASVRLGGRVFWSRLEIEEWISGRLESARAAKRIVEIQPIHDQPKKKRGRPTRKEQLARLARQGGVA